jgi:isochorismate synthase EntC
MNYNNSSHLILGGDGENHFVGSSPERKLLLKHHTHTHTHMKANNNIKVPQLHGI